MNVTSILYRDIQVIEINSSMLYTVSFNIVDSAGWKKVKPSGIIATADCLGLYNEHDVLACVSTEQLLSTVPSYKKIHNGRTTCFFLLTIEGRVLAVRGQLQAKFMYLHHMMPKVVAGKRRQFKESYAETHAAKRGSG
jgi:hypothetical protein